MRTRASMRRIQAIPKRGLPIRSAVRSVRPDQRTVRTDPIRSRAAAIRVRFRSDASVIRSDGPDPKRPDPSDTRSARPSPSDPIRATPSVPPGPSDRPAQPRSVRSDLRSATGQSRAEQAGAGGGRKRATRAVARTECTSPPCRGRADHAASALDLALHAHLSSNLRREDPTRGEQRSPH